METRRPQPEPALTALEQLAPHDHLCSIYESVEEQLAVATSFVRIGLDRGEKCICIVDDGTDASVREALAGAGIDVERALATTSLMLETPATTYLRHGSFDPEWMFNFWADATEEAKRQGYSALRVAGETEWVLRGDVRLERWLEYECQATHLFARHDCLALCQYDRRLLPPDVMLHLIRTHPIVAYRGIVCRNMYHIPPEEFLGADQSAREVERLLSSIREREQVESALRRQRNELHDSVTLFRQIAENIREVLWVWDAIGDQLIFVSAAYEDVFGRSCASLYADYRSFLDAVHVEDRARVEAAGLRMRSGGAPFDERYRIVRPDGSLRWIRSRAFSVPEPTGAVHRFVGVAEDITDQKTAEEELERSERLLRLVLDALPVGVGVVGPTGDLVLSNPAMDRLWNRLIQPGTARYAESKGWWHATGERIGPAEWPSVRAFSHGKTTVNEILEIEAFNGVRKIIQTSALPIQDASDRITGAVVVNEDISAWKAAERQLHDSLSQLRTLTGRLMRAQDDERRRIAQMLHETTAQDLAALKMHLARLNRTATHLREGERAAVIESIALAEQSMTEVRTLSYLLHPPFLDEAGLLSALRWYAAGFSERSGIKVEMDLPEELARLPLDTETTLFRIVQESLTNIHRHAGSETARIRLRTDAAALVLEIGDSGHGMSQAARRQVMNGGGGAGVGIAGMSERIEQLGGSLEVGSDAHGTTVTARAPLSKAGA